MQLTHFKVTKYRNVRDSGWVEVGNITAFVGQNEAGKSNLFEALYRINPFVPDEAYNIDEDWPVDDWGNKDPSALVCQAKFTLTPGEIESFYEKARHAESEPAPEGEQAAEESAAEENDAHVELPSELTLVASRGYNMGPTFVIEGRSSEYFDTAKVDAWAKENAPKFVLIQDYGLSGTQIELDQLTERLKGVEWHELTNEGKRPVVTLPGCNSTASARLAC